MFYQEKFGFFAKIYQSTCDEGLYNTNKIVWALSKEQDTDMYE